eukprot:scaffold242866_cov15-Tisochrysis_lutea.AAC.1
MGCSWRSTLCVAMLKLVPSTAACLRYLSKNALETLLETMMTECLRHKPEEPSHYLLKWLIDQNASKGSEE